MQYDEMRKLLVSCDLKVTPQRIAVLEAFSHLENHPTVYNIVEFVRKNHPSISTGTVYNAIDTLVRKGALRRVKTDRGVMRYDPVTAGHHHLYSMESDRIEDYMDDELDRRLTEYFKSKNIPNFSIENITLQITGKFEDENNFIDKLNPKKAKP